MENIPRNPSNKLGPEEYRHFFISHLHRIYCAKSQLADKLPEIGKQSHFRDLKQAIGETVDTVRQHILRMKDMYLLLGSHYHYESCVGLTGILDEAFQSIGAPGERDELRDLSILFYMQNIESIEMASFKVMMLVAGKMQQPDIVQMLRESYDEAREEKALFKAIMANYLYL